MEKKIIFRAKDWNNEWHYGYYCRDIMMGGIRQDYILESDNRGNANGEKISINIDTLGQFIGLQDKNGLKVYEGDIINTWSAGQHVTNGVIKWGSGPCTFFIYTRMAPNIFKLCGDYYGHDTGIKVIGNVYDNPELVK